MFVAGIVGGVVVGIVSHSDYSDYRDHSQYGDANLVSEIKAKETEEKFDSLPVAFRKGDLVLVQRKTGRFVVKEERNLLFTVVDFNEVAERESFRAWFCKQPQPLLHVLCNFLFVHLFFTPCLG